MSDHAFHGIYPVLYAFHRADGSIDRDAMRKQVEQCLAAGAHGLMVLGLITEVGRAGAGTAVATPQKSSRHQDRGWQPPSM